MTSIRQTNAVPNPGALTDRPIRLIALDDDSIFLAGVARMLREIDCIHELFSEPEAALTHLVALASERALPQLFLVDLHMPRMDGLEFLGRAAFAFDAASTRLYLHSAEPPSRAVVSEAARLGATVLDKSVVLQRSWLRGAVRTCRDHATPRPPRTPER